VEFRARWETSAPFSISDGRVFQGNVGYRDKATAPEPIVHVSNGWYSCVAIDLRVTMNKYVLGVIIGVFGALAIAVLIGLKYSHAALLFGLIAAISASVVIHKVSNKNWSLGMLMGLSVFASFPLKKLFQLDGFINEIPVTLAYFAILWVVGFGWKRSWR
jgi:hypothetical protein